MSNKQAFLSIANRPLKTDSITIEGYTFKIRELSEGDAAKMEIEMQDGKGKFDYTRHRRLMVAYSLIDEAGNRLIDNPDELSGCAKTIISAVYERCLALSDYDPKEVESLVKKSGEASA